jgi:hypothetical protein
MDRYRINIDLNKITRVVFDEKMKKVTFYGSICSEFIENYLKENRKRI